MIKKVAELKAKTKNPLCMDGCHCEASSNEIECGLAEFKGEIEVPAIHRPRACSTRS